MTIGILTSGGDAPGMNAVIAGACEQVERSGTQALGVLGGFAGLAGRRAQPITALEARAYMHEPGTCWGRAAGRRCEIRMGWSGVAARSRRSGCAACS